MKKKKQFTLITTIQKNTLNVTSYLQEREGMKESFVMRFQVVLKVDVPTQAVWEVTTKLSTTGP